MRILILLTMMIGVLSTLNAQNNNGFYNNVEEITVDSLLLLHKDFSSKYQSVSGYRIQIFKGSGNSVLENAEILMLEFKEEWNDIEAYLSFQEPYYRVRVGDFRTRLDALYALKLVKDTYPSAFVIKENIELVVLPKYQNTISYEQEDNSGP